MHTCTDFITSPTTGGGINAMAISNRLSRLRRKAADEGLVPKGVATAPPTKRPKSKGVGRKNDRGTLGGMIAEESE